MKYTILLQSLTALEKFIRPEDIWQNLLPPQKHDFFCFILFQKGSKPSRQELGTN